MRALILTLTALLAVGTLIATTPAEAAAPHGCINRAEYQLIHRGFSKARVAALAGGHGLRAEADARTYRASDTGRVLVQYTHTTPSKVVSKHRVGTLASDPLWS